MTKAHSEVRIDKLRCADDARGRVFEPLNAAELSEQSNVHIVLTEPGHVRGNHLHRVGTEISTVVGPARVSYREGDREPTTVEVPDAEVWRFVFPPGIPHAFENAGNRPMLVVSFNTVVHDPQSPDTARAELV